MSKKNNFDADEVLDHIDRARNEISDAQSGLSCPGKEDQDIVDTLESILGVLESAIERVYSDVESAVDDYNREEKDEDEEDESQEEDKEDEKEEVKAD